LQRVANDSALSSQDRLNAESALAMMEKNLMRAETALKKFRQTEAVQETGGYMLSTNSLAGLALLQGQYEKTGRYLQEARDRRPNSAPQAYEEGLFWLLRGKTAAALDQAQKILGLYGSGAEPFVEIAALGWHLSFQANLAKGHIENAQQSIAELEKLGIHRENEYAFLYDDALGRLACYRGELNTAQQHFTKALATASYTVADVVIFFRKLILDVLLECLEKAGDYKALLRWSEEILPFAYHYHDFNTSTTAVWNRTLLRQARAYEALGQTQKAIEVYEEFLGNWKNADPNLPEQMEAKTRLAKLKRRS
jgi:hypothetical protein